MKKREPTIARHVRKEEYNGAREVLWFSESAERDPFVHVCETDGGASGMGWDGGKIGDGSIKMHA